MAPRFGATWWGRAWLDALEGIAGGGGGRLQRGRRLARTHAPSDLVVSAKGVEATVRDDAATSYDAFVGLRPLRDDEWEAVVDAIAAQVGHAAALLDGELPPEVVDDARTVEVDLLPRPRDLRTACTCPDDAEPCTHAAAICYLLAGALDTDPFVLFLLRGRRRDEILDAVRARRLAARAATDEDPTPAPPPTPPGVNPSEAWQRRPAPLPRVDIAPGAPGRLVAWPTDPPSYAPFSAAGLRRVATDAVERAWALAAGGTDTWLDLDERTDLARLAAAGNEVTVQQLASRSSLPEVELQALAAAWRWGGAAGVAAHDEPRWDPRRDEMREARDLIVGAGHVARRVHVSGNRITAEGQIQFRRSRDGRWYRFAKDWGSWALSAPPEHELDDLLDHELPS